MPDIMKRAFGADRRSTCHAAMHFPGPTVPAIASPLQMPCRNRCKCPVNEDLKQCPKVATARG